MRNKQAKTVYQLDAAVARPVVREAVASDIIGIGRIRGIATASLSLSVQKSGKTSGHTRGSVTVVGAAVTIGFPGGRKAFFTDQIITTKMGGPGDSGSLLLDNTNRAVGLLFAGSHANTIYHPIQEVLAFLRVRLTPVKETEPFPQPAKYRGLRELCRSATPRLLNLPNVVGVGIGIKNTAGVETGDICVTVLVERKVPAKMLADTEKVPASLSGTPTDVIESGKLEVILSDPCLEPTDRQSRVRPARPGVSIGHYRVSAGTFGALVYDKDNGEPLILSNNHVLANATNGTDGLAKPGDPIIQPGRLDGGDPGEDMIATLLRYCPIRFL